MRSACLTASNWVEYAPPTRSDGESGVCSPG